MALVVRYRVVCESSTEHNTRICDEEALQEIIDSCSLEMAVLSSSRPSCTTAQP